MLTALEHLKGRDIGIAVVTLSPLSEDSVMRYVASTLCLPVPVILPLGALILSRTSGNPFYVREMLNDCYEHGFFSYDYREGQWSFDLSRISEHFKRDNYNDSIFDDSLMRRLSSLSPVSKSILAWASDLGMTFSFQLVKRLLSSDETDAESGLSEREMIQGLQATVQAYVIVPTQDHDVFSFTYHHYMHLAASFTQKTRIM